MISQNQKEGSVTSAFNILKSELDKAGINWTKISMEESTEGFIYIAISYVVDGIEYPAGIDVGGKLSHFRSFEDLQNLAALKIVEWYRGNHKPEAKNGSIN